jgi:hypothetical protein
MVPIYALDSWLSLRFKNIALYLDMCRDCYEAYVIYLFLALLIAYLGEENEEYVVEILERKPPICHPFPFSYLFHPIPLDKLFLRSCKRATMQFVAIKPLTTLLAIILEVRLHSLGDAPKLKLLKFDDTGK